MFLGENSNLQRIFIEKFIFFLYKSNKVLLIMYFSQSNDIIEKLIRSFILKLWETLWIQSS